MESNDELAFEFDCEHLFTLLERHRGVPSDSILAVYLVGSRLYGTASADADYDFLVIVEDEAYRALPPVELSAQSENGQPEMMDAKTALLTTTTNEVRLSSIDSANGGSAALFGDVTNANPSLFVVTRMIEYIPGGTEHFSYVSFEFVLKRSSDGGELNLNRVIRADCGLYSRTYFSTQLLEHESFALQVLWLPPRACWKIVRARCPWEMQLPILSHPKLWRSCIREADRTVVISKRFLDGELYKFKKKLIYSLRIFLFAKQIIRSGQILDYTTGNDLFYELVNAPLVSWTEFQEWYRPKLRELYHEIEAWVEFPQKTVCDKFPLRAMNHICELGLVSLSRLYSIHFELLECEEETENGFQLVKLMTLADEPKSTQISNECRGLILRLPRSVANPSLFENRRTDSRSEVATSSCTSPLGDADSKSIPPYSVVAYPFAPIVAYNSLSELRRLDNFDRDISSISVYHKRDGVLCALYWHCGKWKVSFEQLFNYKKEKPNFEELFWRQWHSQGHLLPGEGADPLAVETRNYNFFFELCGPSVGNVCCYADYFLEYLGARCMKSFALLPPTAGAFNASHHWRLPPVLYLPRQEEDSSIDQRLFVKDTNTLIEFLWNQTEHLLPHSAEGFVIVLEESGSNYPTKIVRHHWAIKSPCWLAQKAVLLLPKYVITVQPYHFVHVAREYLCSNYFASEKRIANNTNSGEVTPEVPQQDALAIAIVRAAAEFALYYPVWSVQFRDMCEQIAANFCRKFDEYYLPLVPYLREETREFAKRLVTLTNYNKPLLFGAKAKQYACAMEIMNDFVLLPPPQFEKVAKINKATPKKT